MQCVDPPIAIGTAVGLSTSDAMQAGRLLPRGGTECILCVLIALTGTSVTSLS